MVILLSDPRVRAVPVVESAEPLVALPPGMGAGVLVRAGLADRLVAAGRLLPRGVRLHVVEGFRPAHRQRAIIARYSAELCARHPGIGPDDLDHLTSRFVAPLGVAPHVAGAAVDLTLVDDDGNELDLGTPIDATPEDSDGRCFFAAEDISAESRLRRDLLAGALGSRGLVNYPTEWWHWSYGDRYWALATGAEHGVYGPLSEAVAA